MRIFLIEAVMYCVVCVCGYCSFHWSTSFSSFFSFSLHVWCAIKVYMYMWVQLTIGSDVYPIN